MNTKKRVLFLCTGNSARSQMAEAFLRQYAGDFFEVHSAGFEPRGIHPFTIKVMEEVGFDLSEHTSKGVERYLGKTLVQVLITVCDKAEKNCPTVWPGVHQRLHWSFEDPAAFEGSDAEKLARFRTVRDEIDRKIRTWLAEQSIAIRIR
ncbi:MAG TPA: arsenate reductase ArsC [Anaerolinea thermolimosa]|uniref:Arsenate reductase ArsC n=2 Tax=Anaerolinea thermolimosa TaxID=229919 RepID=A0A3D1JF20_9CHLR|nr:arsenate reductase ArsC [Anaerolinea thermolimosa]